MAALPAAPTTAAAQRPRGAAARQRPSADAPVAPKPSGDKPPSGDVASAGQKSPLGDKQPAPKAEAQKSEPLLPSADPPVAPAQTGVAEPVPPTPPLEEKKTVGRPSRRGMGWEAVSKLSEDDLHSRHVNLLDAQAVAEYASKCERFQFLTRVASQIAQSAAAESRVAAIQLVPESAVVSSVEKSWSELGESEVIRCTNGYFSALFSVATINEFVEFLRSRRFQVEVASVAGDKPGFELRIAHERFY